MTARRAGHQPIMELGSLGPAIHGGSGGASGDTGVPARTEAAGAAARDVPAAAQSVSS